jgi:predicted enzyme related to lactoylglutathione lyase
MACEKWGRDRMSTVHQRCPFYEQVFEIGSDEYEPMKLHIRVAHIEEQAKRGERRRSERRLYNQ